MSGRNQPINPTCTKMVHWKQDARVCTHRTKPCQASSVGPFRGVIDSALAAPAARVERSDRQPAARGWRVLVSETCRQKLPACIANQQRAAREDRTSKRQFTIKYLTSAKLNYCAVTMVVDCAVRPNNEIERRNCTLVLELHAMVQTCCQTLSSAT